MKIQKLIALTILFVTAGTSFIETKGFCGKNKEWLKGKCRTKKKNKSKKKDLIQQNFEPAKQFAAQGLVGVYIEKNNTAKIIDPSHDDTVMYKFNNVVAVESAYESKKLSQDHVEIGSYMVSNKCARGMMCTAVMKNITLFGTVNEKFDAKHNARTKTIAAKIDQETPSMSHEFAAPDMGNHTAIMYQIDNNTDHDVELSFLPEHVPANVRMIPQKETVKAHESILIPQGINRIMLQQSVQQTIELTPFTSYTLVQDVQGNVSFKPQAADAILIDQETPSMSHGFAPPDMENHTAVMYQIYNDTDHDVELSFLPEHVPANVRMIPQKETVKADESVLIPQGINRIILQQQTIKLKPFTSYTLVQDDKGNVSLQAQQIYY